MHIRAELRKNIMSVYLETLSPKMFVQKLWGVLQQTPQEVSRKPMSIVLICSKQKEMDKTAESGTLPRNEGPPKQKPPNGASLMRKSMNIL